MEKKITALFLTLALLLTGCGTDKNRPWTKKDKEETDLVKQGETVVQEAIPAPEGLTMEMEHEVYDRSVERYTYFIRNETGGPTGMFGETYWVQKLEDGQWWDLEAKNGLAFNSIGYVLQPGGVMALTCWMGNFSEERTPGQYRLVKKIEDEISRETYALYAEFEIGDSIYTADTPYGFGSLEMLPETYGADTACEMDVVFTYDGVLNNGAIEEFLFKSGLGADCQLRTVQDYGEGAVLVTDTIYQKTVGNDYFLWRQWQDGVIMEKRFSYLVTDGTDIYLSNGADWASTVSYDSDKVLLLPAGAGPLSVVVQEQTERRLNMNLTRYKIWSEDGEWCAGLPGYDMQSSTLGSPTEFYVTFQKMGEGSRGSTYDLQGWDGLETVITALEWQEDGALRLTCTTLDGGTRVLVFHPKTEELTSFLCICG